MAFSVRRSLLWGLCAVAMPAFAADTSPNAKALAALLKGPLTPESIKDVVHEHHSEVRRCAQARPKDRQQVEGKVVVRFVIGPLGKVSGVEVASTTVSEPKLEACLTQAVSGWAFPKPKRPPVEVKFPFRVGPPKAQVPTLHSGDIAPDESEPDVLK